MHNKNISHYKKAVLFGIDNLAHLKRSLEVRENATQELYKHILGYFSDSLMEDYIAKVGKYSKGTKLRKEIRDWLENRYTILLEKFVNNIIEQDKFEEIVAATKRLSLELGKLNEIIIEEDEYIKMLWKEMDSISRATWNSSSN